MLGRLKSSKRSDDCELSVFKFKMESGQAIACMTMLLSLVSAVSAHTDNADKQRNTAVELSEAQQAVVTVLEGYANAYAAADVEGIAALT